MEDGKKELKKKKPVPTFEQLVADSEKILATLRMTQATTANEKSVSRMTFLTPPCSVLKSKITQCTIVRLGLKMQDWSRRKDFLKRREEWGCQ